MVHQCYYYTQKKWEHLEMRLRYFRNLLNHLSIKEVGKELYHPVIRLQIEVRTESQVYIDSHCADPKHKGKGKVQGEISEECAAKSVDGQKIFKVITGETDGYQQECNAVVDQEANGDFSKQRTADIPIYDVCKECDEKEKR